MAEPKTAQLTLADFLLARIAEDEERARATGPDWDSEDYDEIDRQERLANEQWHSHRCGWRVGEGMEERCICAVPARVLAECEAKRRIVGRCEMLIESFERTVSGSNEYIAWPDVNRREKSHAWNTLHELAAVYGNHPDYRDEWRS